MGVKANHVAISYTFEVLINEEKSEWLRSCLRFSTPTMAAAKMNEYNTVCAENGYHPTLRVVSVQELDFNEED